MTRARANIIESAGAHGITVHTVVHGSAL